MHTGESICLTGKNNVFKVEYFVKSPSCKLEYQKVTRENVQFG